MLHNLQLHHLLTDIPSLAIVVFRLIDDPVEDLFTAQAPFMHCEPPCFEVLDFQLTPHYLSPIL